MELCTKAASTSGSLLFPASPDPINRQQPAKIQSQLSVALLPFKPLFFGTFPTLMRPKPVGRPTTDAFFEQTGIPVGQVIISIFFRMKSHQAKSSPIISAFHTLYIHVIKSSVHLFGNPFCPMGNSGNASSDSCFPI